MLIHYQCNHCSTVLMAEPGVRIQTFCPVCGRRQNWRPMNKEEITLWRYRMLGLDQLTKLTKDG